jgi:predicted flap endonuclease-1-like 5' DNA nuclease
MRKRIKSASFAGQLSVDINELKAVKKQTHEVKKQAKARKNDDTAQLTKEERRALKIEFIRAKIRHKAAKHAWKAAQKVIAPYLLKEVLEETTEEKKKVKHKKDDETIGTPSKQGKVKKVKEAKVNKIEKAEKTEKVGKIKKEAKITKEPKAEKVKKEVRTNKVVKADKTQAVVKVTEPKPTATTEKVVVKTTTTALENKPVTPTVVKQVTAAAPVKTPQKPDDLTIIEGIGPKIAETLVKNGVTSFKQLSLLAADYIKDIMLKNNLRLADPTTWAEQARLAAEGKMEALETLKKELKGGKRA